MNDRFPMSLFFAVSQDYGERWGAIKKFSAQTFGRSIMKETSKIGKVFDNPIFQVFFYTYTNKYT